jgi:hypothetical protein
VNQKGAHSAFFVASSPEVKHVIIYTSRVIIYWIGAYSAFFAFWATMPISVIPSFTENIPVKKKKQQSKWLLWVCIGTALVGAYAFRYNEDFLPNMYLAALMMLITLYVSQK